MDPAQAVFMFFHTLMTVLGMILNGIVVYLAVLRTPKAIRNYSLLIINFGVTDLGASLTDFFVQCRVMPAGRTIAFLSYGPCVWFGNKACFVGHSLTLHFLAHSLYLLLLSFSYRLFVLTNGAPSKTKITALILLTYVPSLIQLLIFSFAMDPPEDLERVLEARFPSYNFNGTNVSGALDVVSWPVLYTALHMTLPVTPVYCGILYCRNRIIAFLKKSATVMSRETSSMHQQLLQALSCQALMPAFYLVGSTSYAIGQTSLYTSPVLEYITISSALCIPVLSPVASLTFVKPYKTRVANWLKCRSCLSTTTIGVEDTSGHFADSQTQKQNTKYASPQPLTSTSET